MQRSKYKKGNVLFKNEHKDIPLPPDFFIYETYRLNFKWYYQDGKNTAKEIVELLSRHVDLFSTGKRILDWGCGPGRIVRHLRSVLPLAEIYGTDYNEEYIGWCSKHLRGIDFSVNRIDPPTGYEDVFFDTIIGLSIFTHLSEKNHFDWINELYRIIKQGGMLFITTQGEAYRPLLTMAEKKVLDSNRLVTRKYSKEGNRLYSSFQSDHFMRQLIKGKFRVLEHIPGKFENSEPAQDNWLLQKI